MSIGKNWNRYTNTKDQRGGAIHVRRKIKRRVGRRRMSKRQKCRGCLGETAGWQISRCRQPWPPFVVHLFTALKVIQFISMSQRKKSSVSYKQILEKRSDKIMTSEGTWPNVTGAGFCSTTQRATTAAKNYARSIW